MTGKQERQHQEDLQRLRGFRLLDDDFMTKCFEGETACVELVLRIVLEKPDLQVTDVRTQVFVENLLNRSVCLDILATDSEGRKINVEIQRADHGAGKRRARYNSAMMDVNLLPKGEDTDDLPETYVVFITENDVLGGGLPLHRISRYDHDMGTPFDDGTHIIYVNGAYRGSSPIGLLMHDFACTDPAEMHYNALADRVRFYKESKEGVAIMCKVMEEMREQSLQEGLEEGMKVGRKENAVETAKRMLADGHLSLEKIAEFAGLNLDEVEKLQTAENA
ncbi:PD-(D/E)XK nuclease family transposase [Acutalibacter sp. 1XD8-36]|uniref:PD-(D/E)XK nuclease family transposase n=1 Tax=Acutalibacter sp. 1XD8-36 TaxID=2320852 RepID=UPI001412A780|nr:PD-(D/E)XK nuclease family transposase [Acutalibacter sp. 1XD8-36]NBJ88516.1 nuclease [Acutalibacter sp. 1XD8-36]